jgi:hypothetical protein
VVVTGLVQASNFIPLIFGQIINFALGGRLVGILRTNSVNIIFCFVLEAAVEMAKLVAGTAIEHGSSALYFVSKFV